MKKIFGVFIGIASLFVSSVMLASCGESCKHDWQLDEMSSTSPTCKADGVNKYFCSLCNEQKEEAVPSQGTEHKIKDNSECNAMNDEAKKNASCGAKYEVYGKCEYCGTIGVLTENFKSDHKFNTYKVSYEKIVDNDGVVNTQKHNKVSGMSCDICGQFSPDAETVVEEHNADAKHDNSITSVNKANELGYCKYYENQCTCGYEYAIGIEHSWDNGTIKTAATCTKTGVMEYRCTDPDCQIKVKQETINALGHQFKAEEKDKNCIDRECAVCGTVEASASHTYPYNFDCCDKICSVCGHSESSTALHQYADDAECHDRICVICNSPDSIKHANPNVSHQFPAEAVERKDCTDRKETYTKTCLECHETITFDWDTSYNAHEFVEIKHVDADCTEAGYTKKCCTRCSTEKTDTFDALGHNYNGDVAECHDRTCSVCGHVETFTKSHELGTDGTRCLACGEVIKLSKPIVQYDSETATLKVDGDSTYTKYYLVTSETTRAAFNGNLSTYGIGEYKVCAKNVDSTGHLIDSEESDILTIWVLKENPFVSGKINSKSGRLVLTLKENTANIPYHLFVEYYCGDTVKQTKTYKNYVSGNQISVDSSLNITKIVITLQAPEDLEKCIYDGVYTFTYIYNEE